MVIELARMTMTEPPGSALEKRNFRSEEKRLVLTSCDDESNALAGDSSLQRSVAVCKGESRGRTLRECVLNVANVLAKVVILSS